MRSTKASAASRIAKSGTPLKCRGPWSRASLVSFAVLTALSASAIGEEQPDAAGLTKVPGVVIDHSPAASGIYIGSPSIAVLPNGHYVASHDQFGPKSTEHQRAVTRVFRSTDKGRTWTHLSDIDGQFWSNLFVHRDGLYIFGTLAHYNDTVIRRSIDGGRTWTVPKDAVTGRLLAGRFHCAPVPVVVHEGRLWRAMEDTTNPRRWGLPFRAMMLSAPVDADLLRAESWTCTNKLAGDPSWLGNKFNGWLEGNAVVTPEGRIVDVLRVDCPEGGKAAVVEVSRDGRAVSFDPESGWIDFPGGAKKFTVRYDAESKRYWSLTNYVLPKHRGHRAAGVRNALALTSSGDLRKWKVNCILLYHPDVSRHAFQYPDWQFDGDDIIAAVRTAYDDGLGGAHNAHDANYLTFHRFRNFRRLTPNDSVSNAGDVSSVPPHAGWDSVPTPSSSGQSPNPRVRGGLLVVIGASGVEYAASAVASGPFLAQILDRDPKAIDRARQSIDAKGLGGLVSADVLGPDGKLPYCENLVNQLVVMETNSSPLLAEAARVLCARGELVVAAGAMEERALRAAGFEDVRTVSDGGVRLVVCKPWPAGMDRWGHPRHGPDGNAVSRDAMIGPPRRVRWVAGPPQEINNMVSSGGRNFYAGLIARDGFNGLRLWQQSLQPSPARGGFSFHTEPGSVRPIADGDRLYVVTEKRLVALDAATGKRLREYPEAGTPLDLVAVDAALLAIDADGVRAVEADSGQLRWRASAVEPRYVIAGGGAVYWVSGKKGKEGKCTAVAADLTSGSIRWQRDFDWLAKVRGCVYHDGLLAYEISTLSDDKAGNLIHVISADRAAPQWSHTFVPGMAHMKQARAMFAGDLLWVLDDKKCVGMDPQSGAVRKTHPAGWGHCFPPVATDKYLFAGEMNLTDLATGVLDANRISKGACSRDGGFVLANGLIYTTPKHCVCWPMLRDYSALAPARPGDPLPASLGPRDFVLERGVSSASEKSDSDADWPCYRHDAWRSASTTARVPARLKTLWTVDLGGWPKGSIADDWRENPFARGPVTAPVGSGSVVLAARTDAHQIVALDVATGQRRWTFTANGRIDTPPTIHRGLCLFGTRTGWVYCLRAGDGRLVWRLRAAPIEERIVAYGQVESPWPVPGSVLVIDGVAFFAAGRQPLADGGILVFAAEPATGEILWVQRLSTVPQKEFYGGAALEFKAFDLLQQEGSAVAMSRWLFDRRTGQMTCDAGSGFARLTTSESGVIAPRGFWSYGPRYESEQSAERPFVEPLAAFRGNSLFGGSQDRKSVYRRDFALGEGEKFDSEWTAKWKIFPEARKGGDLWRSQRLARKAAWSHRVSDWLGSASPVAAMVLTPDALFVAGAKGGLAAVSPKDGSLLGRTEVPAPVWDGMAALGSRLVLTTAQGQVVCLAERPEE